MNNHIDVIDENPFYQGTFSSPTGRIIRCDGKTAVFGLRYGTPTPILSAQTSSRKSVISGFSDFYPEGHKPKALLLDKKSSDCKPFLLAKVRAALKAKRKSQKEARRNGRKGR